MIKLAAVPLLAVAFFGLDQWSKSLVQANLAVGESWMPVDAIYDWLRVTHVRNSGAAFGMFPWANDLFKLIAIGVMIGIAIYAFRNRAIAPLWVQASLGLILGGISGNLIDRLRYGNVTDFIDFGYRANWWPVFNIADSSVVVGITLLAVYIGLQPQAQPAPPESQLDAQ
ncbi:MAG: signal peptidase II [Chloroflexi bacterium]|nr:signal peptidase II [Chloroflexota bacterium]